jgi:cytochrome c
MTKLINVLAVLPFLAAAPAMAQDAAMGDAAAGEKVFAKCATCHSMTDADGNKVAGRGAKVGPNLYGMPGRVAGTYPEFKYGDGMVALGATGFVWNEADFITYVADPSKFLEAKLNDPKVKGKMMFKLTDATAAADVWAYISSLSPAPEAAASGG